MKVVILCGGLGTRAYPYTQRMPKALMPVAGAPVLEQVMRIYASHGVDEFVLALGYMKEDIIRYCESRRGTYKIECVDTGDTTDTGGRVHKCLDYVGPTFHCTYVDGLGDVDISGLAAIHRRTVEERGVEGTVTVTPLRSQYGILRHDENGLITDFEEKPILREHLINAGFFVFEREALARTRGENLERDILPALAQRRTLLAHRHYGFWRSMDTAKDQQEVNRLWAPFSAGLEERLPSVAAAIPDWLAGRHLEAAAENA